MKEKTLFADILIESKDGEWGEGTSEVGLSKSIIIRGTDFSKIHLSDHNFPIRYIKQNLVDRKKLEPGDILLETAGGTSKQSTGRSAFLKRSFVEKNRPTPILCASFARFLRINHSKYSAIYIYYYLQALYESGYMSIFNIQHTGVSRFQFTTFKNKTLLEIPSLPTQRKIAAVLSAYDDLIENNTRRIALLERMAEELYKEWFVRMRFPGHEQTRFVKGIPEGWTEAKFINFCVLQRGYDLPDNDIISGEYPVVASTSIKAYHHKYKVEAPVITTGRSGSLGTVLLTNSKAWPLNTSLYVKDFCGNSHFLIYFTLKNLHLENFNAGAGVPSLNRNHLNGLKINLPDKGLQSNFHNIVEKLFQQKELIFNASETLRQTRDRLLTRLISGKLSVEELDIAFPPSMLEDEIVQVPLAQKTLEPIS